MTGVVLDTNVVVSGNLSDEGLEASVVSLALARSVQLYLSEPILEEYERVLKYPKLRFRPEEVDAFMSRIRLAGKVLVPRHAVDAATHQPDNRFLECAEEAGADFLVTGNLRHFPQRWKGTGIVNSRQFLVFFLQRLR